jgi:hypothetical protein
VEKIHLFGKETTTSLSKNFENENLCCKMCHARDENEMNTNLVVLGHSQTFSHVYQLKFADFYNLDRFTSFLMKRRKKLYTNPFDQQLHINSTL